MNRRPHLPTICLLVALAGCVGTDVPRATLATLQPGQFVELVGTVEAGRPLVREIDEIVRAADDKADKVELYGPNEAATAGSVQLLGHTFAVAADTTFEDADKQRIDPYVPTIGEWLRVKARRKDDETRARTVRRMAPREQFKVTGEVRAVDPQGPTVDVGGIRLPVAQGVDVSPLSQNRTSADDPLALFLGEDQKAVPFSLALGGGVSLGGQAAGEYEWNDEFDLDRTDDKDRVKPDLRGRLGALWLMDDAGSYALGEITFGRDDTIRQNDPDTYNEVLEVSRAFVSWRAHESLQLLVGRQDFDEEREWLYDEVLDGVRAIWRSGRFELQLGIAQGRDFAAEENRFEDVDLLSAIPTLWLTPDWRVSAYALQMGDASPQNHAPQLFGVRSLSQPRYGLGHWLELGIARGESGARDVDGYAFDVGGLWALDLPLRPTIGAGFAFGSGEADGARSTGYRQSGIQDNNAKMGGVTSVRYYGELLDPELANLAVTTLCASIRPFEGASLSVLFHTYRQDVASTQLPTTELRTQPLGRSRDLGSEVDVVFGYRLRDTLTVEAIYGRFAPGSAWADDPSAHLFVLTTRLSF